jgi:pyruvate-formate lyase-activating enzyme
MAPPSIAARPSSSGHRPETRARNAPGVPTTALDEWGRHQRPTPKFSDPAWTADGQARATVVPVRLETLWFNTGTLCNIACRGCYIESSPRNDRLAYLTREEVRRFLDEGKREHPALREIGFTGGEPFMNPDIIGMLEDALVRGFRVLVLTNAMKPMEHRRTELLELRKRFSERLSLRVSLDHYTQAGHEFYRGARSWQPTLAGLRWLSSQGFDIAVAARMVWSEGEDELRAGFEALFREHAIRIDAADPGRLVLFPDMDGNCEVPEITEKCWGLLGKNPASVMCATSRMVEKRKGDAVPVVVSCTLLPYDERFTMGRSLGESLRPARLNHPHCAKFCVLGGASCSARES